MALFRRLLALAVWALALSAQAGVTDLRRQEQRVIAALPFEQQFAPMLAAGDGSMVLLSGGSEAAVWHLWPTSSTRHTKMVIKGWQVPTGKVESATSDAPAKYASVASRDGIWLLGPSVELLRPDGQRISARLRWPRYAPQAVALDDGSVLVAGGLAWNAKLAQDAPQRLSVERLSLAADGRIVVEPVAPLPLCTTDPCPLRAGLVNFALVSLGQGRAMLAGGDKHQNSYVYDGANRRWRLAGKMGVARSHFTLTALPDGTLLAAGGFANDNVNQTSTELWSPASNTWRPGPSLPVVMGEHSALLVDGKTVLLAGGRFGGVLAWTVGAPAWAIVAMQESSRAGGGVLSYGKDKLAVFGGLYPSHECDIYWQAAGGYSLLTLATGSVCEDEVLGLETTRGAFAQRGGQVFVAAGTLVNTANASMMPDPTSQVALFDVRANQARILPSLPLAAHQAQASWLDAQHVLVLASLDTDIGQRWLGIVDLASGRQSAQLLPASTPWDDRSSQFGGVRLAGSDASRAWLIGENAAVRWFDLTRHTLAEAPRLLRQRRGFNARVLANGTVVVAGGEVESEMVLARTEQCPACPERYVGFGPPLPSRRHEIYDPARQVWTSSAASRASGGPVAILADGRVAKLGYLHQRLKNSADPTKPIERDLPLLELSDRAGTSWRTLVPPLTLEENGQGRVLAPVGPGLAPGILLFGHARTNGEYDWWIGDVDGANPGWRALGLAAPPYFFVRGRVDSGLRNASGHKIWLVGAEGGVAAVDEQ